MKWFFLFPTQPLANETNLLPEEVKNSALYKEPVDPAKWFGIRKDATVLGYSKVIKLTSVAPVIENKRLGIISKTYYKALFFNTCLNGT